MGLRKGQKELVEQYRSGYCAVPAIPGGGKTYCLSLWASEMIARGFHKPGKILIVTYMNSAVNNFKQRIAKCLETMGINSGKDYHVSTIHALCMQIIKEKPGLANINEEFDIIDGTLKLYIINDAIEEWKKSNLNLFRYYIDDNLVSNGYNEKLEKNWQDKLCSIISAAIADFKSRGLNPTDALKITSSLSKTSLLKHAAYIYDIYDRRLKASGLVDFDDMLRKAWIMLSEDADLLAKFRKKFSYVCEDEAQDSNLIQSKILSLIANGNLLRVGDSNQAICSTFTNSDFKYFKDFCNLHETVVYNITQSSRSTTDIIDLANYLVRFVNSEHPVDKCRSSLLPQFIEPVDENDEKGNPVIDEYGIKTAVFNSWEEEAEGVARYVWHMLKKHPEKSFAVLAPTSWKLNDLAAIMDARGIRYEELDGSSGIKTRALKLLGRVLAFYYSPDDSKKFADMINDCFLEKDNRLINDMQPKMGKQESVDIIEMKKLLIEYIAGIPVGEILYPESGEINTGDLEDDFLKSEVWLRFKENLSLIRELIEFPAVPVERLILEIADVLGFDREEKAIGQKVAGDVKYMSFRKSNWQLCDLAEELLDSRSMYGYFAGIVWDLKGYEPSPGVVTLSTCHKAKGLEWDVVFLAGLSYADFPVNLSDKFAGEYWFLKQQYKNPQALIKTEMEGLMGGGTSKDSILESRLETISERARLLYVGITRAKEYLFLSGFHSNKGKRNEVQPSAYLAVLKRFIEERTQKT